MFSTFFNSSTFEHIFLSRHSYRKHRSFSPNIYSKPHSDCFAGRLGLVCVPIGHAYRGLNWTRLLPQTVYGLCKHTLYARLTVPAFDCALFSTAATRKNPPIAVRGTHQYASQNEHDLFYQWAAGIINGDGSFEIRKQVKLIVEMHVFDLHILRFLCYKLGGSVIPVNTKNVYRWTVCHPSDMQHILHGLNGWIFARTRKEQFEESCARLKITVAPDRTPDRFSSFFAGYFDCQGSLSVTFPVNGVKQGDYNPDVSIGSQERVILDMFHRRFGGHISQSNNQYLWSLTSEHDLLGFYDFTRAVHFRSSRNVRLDCMPSLLALMKDSAYRMGKDPSLVDRWSALEKQWRSYNHFDYVADYQQRLYRLSSVHEGARLEYMKEILREHYRPEQLDNIDTFMSRPESAVLLRSQSPTEKDDMAFTYPIGNTTDVRVNVSGYPMGPSKEGLWKSGARPIKIVLPPA